MKKTIMLLFMLWEVSLFAQYESSSIYLSSSFSSKQNMISFGARGYYDGHNGADSYLQISFTPYKDIIIGGEMNFQSQLFDLNRKVFFITGQYKLDQSISLGSFVNLDTDKYGFIGTYQTNYNLFNFHLKAVTDLKFEDYTYSLTIQKQLLSGFNLLTEFLLSEGNIQSNLNKSLALISVGFDYSVFNNVAIFCSYGYNLLDQYEYNLVNTESVLIFGTGLKL